MSEYYLYQCAGCGTTLGADRLPDGEQYTSVMNGELCSPCQQQQEGDDWYDDDD